jgi:hypothetical protein
MTKDQTKMISDLSRNMDSVLSRITSIDNKNSETSDSIKSLSKMSDSISEKIKGSVLSEISGKIEGKIGESITKGIKEFGESKDFSKILTGDIGDKISEMIGKIGDNAPKVNIPFKDLSKGESSDIFSKLADSGIPGFKAGGEIQKSGMTLVGEEGPELIIGNKGDNVVSNDSLSSLDEEKTKEDSPEEIKMLSKFETSIEKAIENNFPYLKGDKQLVYDFMNDIQPYMDDSAYRLLSKSEPLLLDDLKPFLDDRDLIQEQLDTFTPEDVKKLGEPIEKSEDSVEVQEKVTLEESLSDNKSDKKEKKNRGGKIKDFIKDKTSGIKDNVNAFLDPLKDLKKKEQDNVESDNVPDSLDTINENVDSGFSMENGYESLGSVKDVPEKPEVKQSQQSQSSTIGSNGSEADTQSSIIKSKDQPESKGGSTKKSDNTGESNSPQDPPSGGIGGDNAIALLTEIKDLLSGPLRVFNSGIDRPNSYFK